MSWLPIALISDSQYSSKIGWGHSCVSQVVNLAHQADVKTLSLFHHDPDQTDEDIDQKLDQANSLLQKLNSNTECIAASEGQSFEIC